MRRKLGIALILAVVMVVSLCAPVLAWDHEDPEVANNNDFIVGVGIDLSSGIEGHTGGQSWGGGDGYNLYQDNISDTGNLDIVFISTYTPGEITLPNSTPSWWIFPGTASGVSIDTWYWALEARGYNQPKHEKHYITIILPDARLKVERYGTMRYADVDFNDGTWRIQIAAGVRIWSDESGAARLLVVDENGNIVPDVWFMRGEPIVTQM